jgi:Holliday junction resolvase RusA-like endonuclease
VTTQTLTLQVPGSAAPQGSKRHVGGGRMIESSPHVRKWRATVASHTLAAIVREERQGHGTWPATGPCRLTVTFHFPRPKHHYRTGKFATVLRAVAPARMQTGPDLDKLVRAIGDALTDACAILDDRQIDVIYAGKKWTEEDPYTSITVEG